jgi:hypothetical protein
MGKKNTGKAYEELTEKVFKILYATHGNAEILRDVMMEGIDGPRQIDVLIKVVIADITHNIIIECRDFNKRLSITHIDGFESKMKDVRANLGILVSPKGFAKSAITKAKRYPI